MFCVVQCCLCGCCPRLERCYGKARFCVILLASGLGGVCLSTAPFRKSVASVGASGVVFGMMAALHLLRYQSRVTVVHEQARQSFVCFVVYFASECVLAVEQIMDERRSDDETAEWVQFAIVLASAIIRHRIMKGDSFGLDYALLEIMFFSIILVKNVDHMAHVGGAIGGAVACFGMLPKVTTASRPHGSVRKTQKWPGQHIPQTTLTIFMTPCCSSSAVLFHDSVLLRDVQFWWQPRMAAPWVLRRAQSVKHKPLGGERTEGSWRSFAELAWVGFCLAIMVGLITSTGHISTPDVSCSNEVVADSRSNVLKPAVPS